MSVGVAVHSRTRGTCPRGQAGCVHSKEFTEEFLYA